MDIQEKIKYIRERCIEANPEIVELKFGCRIKITEINYTDTVVAHLQSERELKTYYSYRVLVDDIEKIIGRPIRLADVLLAIEKRQGEAEYIVTADGHFLQNLSVSEVGFYTYEATKFYWNLKDNNLENQSEECKNFIYELLEHHESSN